MTGAEALSALEKIGARIVLLPSGALDVTAPRRPETEALIDELAAHKPEAVAVLLARPRAHPCVDCGAEVGPALLLCTSCHEAHIERRKLVPFDPERKRRALHRLVTARCGTCGRSWWRLNARADAVCVFCERDARRLLATPPQEARTAERPARSIPPEAHRPGGAA